MTPSTTSPRSRARTAAAALAALLLTAGALLIASPASAHDELVSSDPAADASLDGLPAQLTMTFSGEVATDPGATEVQVTDAAGTALTAGDPAVDGTVVTQALSGEASGAVTVLWKVVSSDGHPISGEYSFSVASATTPTPTPSASASAAPPVETVAPTEPAETVETPAPVSAGEDSRGQLWPWVVGGIVLLAIAGGVVYLLVSRARQQKSIAENRERALGGAARTGPSTGPGSASGPGSGTPSDR